MAISKLEFRGGHVAVEFVNTVAWRGDPARTVDHLDGYSDLLDWAALTGVVDTPERFALRSAADHARAAAGKALSDARRLREQLHAMWTGDGEQREAVSTAFGRAATRRRLRSDGDRVYWTERELGLRTPADRIVIAAVELCTAVAPSAIRACGDTECGWLFLDASPRQNRRWCSTADCGNRARVRRHYRRSRKPAAVATKT
ncbi:hypothetical protein B1R94_11815 [Mycolicibacterium litorale]|nr:hypothetical protein B1R94_11815 [Mycolicibacterium litorale]